MVVWKTCHKVYKNCNIDNVVPFYAPDMRKGKRMGDTTFVDGMIKDGLWDVYVHV